MFHNIISICVLMIATFSSAAKIYLPTPVSILNKYLTLLLMWHRHLRLKWNFLSSSSYVPTRWHHHCLGSSRDVISMYLCCHSDHKIPLVFRKSFHPLPGMLTWEFPLLAELVVCFCVCVCMCVAVCACLRWDSEDMIPQLPALAACHCAPLSHYGLTLWNGKPK